MFHLYSHVNDLRLRGVEPKDTFLGPSLRPDAQGISAPVVLHNETTGEDQWFVKHQEKGAVEACPALQEAQVVYHSPYMLLEDDGMVVEPGLSEAVSKAVGTDLVQVQFDLAVSRYADLSSRVTLRVSEKAAGAAKATTQQKVDTETVVQRFRNILQPVIAPAQRIAQQSAETAPLLGQLAKPLEDTRFIDLDKLLQQRNLDAVLVVSPINKAELTGMQPTSDAVLYRAHSTFVEVLVGPLVELVVQSGVTELLIEEHSLGIENAKALEAAGVRLHNGADILAKWRERRDWQYLPALVVVSRVSRDALDGAVAWAKGIVASEQTTTEKDVKDKYLEIARDLAAEWGLEGYIQEFFSNCHAAHRTLHPSLATEAVIDKTTTTLKLDAGLALVVDGVTLATSDVASTYVGNDNAARLYDLFRDIVRCTISQKIRPGAGFADLHTYIVDELYGHRKEIEALGFWPTDIDLRERYAMRNVGHLMGRQESFSSEFRVGDEEIILVGDYGACEIQWPYANHAFGVEDMWFVTEDATILLTH